MDEFDELDKLNCKFDESFITVGFAVITCLGKISSSSELLIWRSVVKQIKS